MIIPSVYLEIYKEDIGYIQITSFAANTATEFKEKLAKLQAESIKDVIIDLRNNPGGYSDQAIIVADLLLGAGTLVTIEDKEGNREYINSDEEKEDINYVVLVNEASASASELVAAAIKDNKGGKIVGTNTFGKGIMQEVKVLPDGSLLKLTTRQFLTPKGDIIHKVGIMPDYVVELKPNTLIDTQFEKACEVLQNK